MLKLHYGKRGTTNFLFKSVYLSVFIIFVAAFIEIINMPSVKANNKLISNSDSTGSGTVAPLGPFKKNAEVWFKRMGTTKQKWLSQLPSKAELGVPVYPGAVIVVYQSGFSAAKEALLPELGLTTPDPIKKVESWYKNRLKNWTYDKDYDDFLPPGKTVDVMSDKLNATPHVILEKVFQKGQVSGMFINQPENAKTLISIRYIK